MDTQKPIAPTLDNLTQNAPVAAPQTGLEQLNDILVPQTVTTYVITPGLVICAVAIAIMVMAAYLFYRKHKKSNAYKSIAIVELRQWMSEQSPDATINSSQLSYLNGLLKRVAMSQEGRRKVASLYGAKWQDYLTSTGNLPEPIAVVLSENQYQNNHSEHKLNELCVSVEKWIKNYRPPKELASSKTVQSESAEVSHA
ncbi:DUF4381 domain-containing protein [Sessilibacter sp. MAH1]